LYILTFSTYAGAGFFGSGFFIYFILGKVIQKNQLDATMIY